MTREAPAPPEVIVVAYGSPEMLAAALAPLKGRFPLTVVDNSSDARVAAVVREAGGAYWDPGANLGFGSGVNYGLARRQAPGADVLLLNPDAVVEPAMISVLHAALHAGPRIAAVGPLQVDERGRPAQVAWPYPRPAHFLGDAVKLGRFVRNDGPPYVIGSILLLNAEAVGQVGSFDETFFLYAEEADWQLRAEKLGWRNVVVEDVTAVHVGAGTSSDSFAREVFLQAGLERFLRKHYGWWGWQLARWSVAIGGIPRVVFLRGDRRRAAKERAWLFARGPVSVERRIRLAEGEVSSAAPQ
ncbi:glycosyltransferase [Microbacterium sp. CPCC 204701]|uniref:glycosyltransferase n=1 Tax=Microbacterium sp. CPCC 204701 TaxID=2493084 RepID=UPI0013E3A96A|nr:glycosyltransferase [Microbacterium sp. CPCC 204701]